MNDIVIAKGKPFPMGATLVGNDVNIAVAARDLNKLSIVLYKGKSKGVSYDISDEYRVGDVYGFVLKNFNYKEYCYNFSDGKTIFCDPYAKKLAGCDKWGVRVEKGCFYFPETEVDDYLDVKPEISYNELILYQLHVRGFTKHSSSNVSAKGCFEGVVEKIPYLKELGVNGIEFMPVYEFDEIIKENNNAYYKDLDKKEEKRINYWGFSDGFYFAPKSAYSQIGDAPKSFMQMVRALHREGIEVILQFYFPEKISILNIILCLQYWVINYNVDGFHIMGNSIPIELISQNPLLSHTKLLYNNMDIARIYPDHHTPTFINMAHYNDGFMYDCRKFLKGDADMLRSVTKHFVNIPADAGTINYITNYDGFTLCDLLSYERKHNEDNGEDNRDGNDYNFSWNCGAEGPCRKKSVASLRDKLYKNAMLFLLLSAGTPLLRAGDEFLNSQKGNNNAYCQDNNISYLNWNDKEKNKEFHDFVKKLIAFRKEHKILHPSKAYKFMDNESKGFPDISFHGEMAYYPQYENYNRHIGMLYNGSYAKEKEASLMILYNMYWMDKVFALPNTLANEEWEMVLRTDFGFLEVEGLENQDSIKVPARSAFVLRSVEKGTDESSAVIVKKKGKK